MQIGLSPCPNDTYIFYALVHGIITKDIVFEPLFEDVETLNNMAFEDKLPITKLSFNAYFKVQSAYQLLDAGAALGQGCGPLLIAKQATELSANATVAIPGEHTTAHLLLNIFYPNIRNKIIKSFNRIEDMVIGNEADAGVIIHENRFTYAERGLSKIDDLGERWERETQCLLPLGGIFIQSKYKNEKKEISNLIKKSIEYAHKNTEETLQFCKKYAQEMEVSIMKKHIDLYVNKYTLSLGDDGKKAIEKLKSMAGY